MEAGARVGPYEIVGSLGAGGMGEVYRARDPRLDRTVAIKLLSGVLASDPAAFVRFEQEIRAASALNHPNIISIHDTGTHDSRPFVVMELVDGQSLREILYSGSVPLKKAVQLAAQIAEGLAAAHGAGIVHRDLKPENVMVKSDGLVKILDFGLAKLSAPASSSTSMATQPAPATTPGMILGTVGYMSPEQARGQVVDYRSDQFSFGSILYELITGSRAFQRESTAQTLAAIIEDEPPPVEAAAPQSPAPVRWIIERCLAKDHAERYHSTVDLARDLRTIERHLRERSTVSGSEAPARPSPWRRGRLPVALAAGIALGAAAAVLLLWPSYQPPSTFRTLTFSGVDASPTISPDRRTLAFASARDGRPRIWVKQLGGGAEVALTSGPDVSPRFSPDGSSILFLRQSTFAGFGVKIPVRSDLYRVAALGGEPRRIGSDVLDADWSPDGTHVVVLTFRTGAAAAASVLTIQDENGSSRQVAVLEGVSARFPRWSPDGHRIAVSQASFGLSSANRIMIVDVDSGAVQSLEPPAAGGDVSAALWLTSDTILYGQAESSVAVGIPVSGGTRLIRQSLTGVGRVISWIPSQIEGLALAGPESLILDTHTARQNLFESPIPGSRQNGPAQPAGVWLTRGATIDRQPIYSTDGAWVAFTSNRTGNLDLWAASPSTRTVKRLTDHPGDDWDPIYVGAANSLLWSSNRSGPFEIWSADADGVNARKITNDGVDAENPTATPDGAWVVYYSGNPSHQGLRKIRRDGGESTALAPGTYGWPAISPDGRYVVATALLTNRAELRVYRLADAVRLPFTVVIDRGGTGHARWTSDGRRLVYAENDPQSRASLYTVDFSEHEANPTPRLLLTPDVEGQTESFGLSPDGTRVVLAVLDDNWMLVTLDGLKLR